MRRAFALFALVTLLAAPPALAQTPAPADEAGVSVADARAWLTSLGGSVGEPRAGDGMTTLHVADQPLPWTLTFYGCGPSLCGDVQYSAAFSGPITAERINDWNREHRFLKAFFVPASDGGEAGAVVQYDVVLTGVGTGQLHEPTVIWLQMLRQFAGGLVAEAPAQPSAGD